MKVIIDSNSLLSLVRYYLHFDKDLVLFTFIKTKIEEGEIIIIDRVHEECRYFAKGLVLSRLDYLNDNAFLKHFKLPYKTESLLPPSPGKFLRQVDNQFVNGAMKNRLSPVEYDNEKNRYLGDADMRQIILSLHLMDQGEDVILVTEETDTSNDNKLFKKIPAIARELGLRTLSLPELLTLYQDKGLAFIFNASSSLE